MQRKKEISSLKRHWFCCRTVYISLPHRNIYYLVECWLWKDRVMCQHLKRIVYRFRKTYLQKDMAMLAFIDDWLEVLCILYK